LGKQPVDLKGQAFVNAVKPDGAADWAMQLQVRLLFPKYNSYMGGLLEQADSEKLSVGKTFFITNTLRRRENIVLTNAQQLIVKKNSRQN
jgi:hypothetical protein